MKKQSLILSLFMLVALPCWGQSERIAFRHLEFGATIGNAGIGFDFAAPITADLRLRTGFSFTPHIKTRGSLDVCLNGEVIAPVYDETGYRTDRMGKLIEMMESFTGYKMEEQVDFYTEPTMWNGKILVDWFPFEQKTWHLTAGIYLGPSEVAYACNEDYEMHTLTGLGIYNGLYDRIMEGKPILTVGDQQINFPADYVQKVQNYGAISLPAGKKNGGSFYDFCPGSSGLSEATVSTNPIRPFLGGGFTYWFEKEQRTSVSLDCGLLFWGTPDIIDANGVDLVNDVVEVTGELGRWVDRYASHSVMPMLELRISRRLF